MHTLYVDGACSGNPGPGGWAAICIGADGTVKELGGFEKHTTNNAMELQAAIEGILFLKKIKAPIQVFIDSSYVLRGITEWLPGWKRNGWKTKEGNDVANQERWQELAKAVEGVKVQWTLVKGHSGNAGNERVDQIAVGFSKGEDVDLFSGSREDYQKRYGDLTQHVEEPKHFSPYYLSYVRGELKKHATWPECEAHVRGASGAKYKKITSRAMEQATLKLWGLSVDLNAHLNKKP